MAFSVESKCRIENKVFFLGPDKQRRGRVLLREKNRDNWHALSLEPQLVVLDRPKNHKFFMRKESVNGTCWVHKVINRRGMLVDISKVAANGEKTNLFVPSGVDKKGWKNFVYVIDSKFEAPESVVKKPKKQAFVRSSTSFVDAVRRTSSGDFSFHGKKMVLGGDKGEVSFLTKKADGGVVEAKVITKDKNIDVDVDKLVLRRCRCRRIFRKNHG